MDEKGKKHVLGIAEGASENHTVAKGQLEDLVRRGLKTDRKFIITETYVKQTQRLGTRERRHVEAAIHRKRDYIDRTRREDYYEQD